MIGDNVLLQDFWYLLGVLFKISDEYPRFFIRESPRVVLVLQRAADGFLVSNKIISLRCLHVN